MNIKFHSQSALKVISTFVHRPNSSRRLLNLLPAMLRGEQFAQDWHNTTMEKFTSNFVSNPLYDYFNSHIDGPGILKWEHYFDVYHRHFQKFIGREVHLLEIGVHSGGSIDMWQAYFGPACHIYAVDIEPACKTYESERVKVFIGDQADRTFWKDFRQQVPRIDLVIDDGGHHPEQQIVTLEEMLPHLSKGGIYACEDSHGSHQNFTAFVQGIENNFNTYSKTQSPDEVHPYFEAQPTQLQRDIHSIHHYPYLTIIEKHADPLKTLISHKHGTRWQPFPFEQK